jgi:hypothetical protein
MKRSVWVRRLLIVACLIAAVVAVVLVVAVMRIEDVVKVGIEKTLSYVLEVDVTVEKVDVRIRNGHVTVRGIRIGNPEGFDTDHAFEAGVVEAKVNLRSFTSQQQIIHEINIRHPSVILEQGLRSSNLSRLIESASRFSSDQPPGEDAPEEVGKPMVIETILVESANVSLSAPVLRGQKLSIPLPTLTIRDIGKGKDKPAIAEAMIRFFGAILKEIAAMPGDLVPAELREALGASLQDVMGRMGAAGGLLKQTGAGAVQGVGEAGGRLKDASEGAREGLRRFGEGLQGFVPGEDEDK